MKKWLFSYFALVMFANASIFVESVGLGESVQSAKQDAINNGIREAVGEYVRAKQTLQDENLNEQILNFSNAYLLDYKQLSVSKLPNGVYEVKAKLEIEDGKLVGVLRDLQVDVKNVDDGTFKVYVSEKQKQIDSFTNLFEEVVLEPLRSGEAYQVKVLNFEPCELSSKKDRTCRNGQYIISFSMDYQKGYLEGVAKLLKSAGAQKCSSYLPTQATRKEVAFFLFGECIFLPRKFSDTIIFKDMHQGVWERQIAILRLELLDENKKTIASFSPNEKYTEGLFIKQHSEKHPPSHHPADLCHLMSMRNPFNAHTYFFKGRSPYGGCFDFPSGFEYFDRRMTFVHTKKIFPYYAMIDSENIARIKEIKIFFEHAKNRK